MSPTWLQVVLIREISVVVLEGPSTKPSLLLQAVVSQYRAMTIPLDHVSVTQV